MIAFSFAYGWVTINVQKITDLPAHRATEVSFQDESVEFEQLLRPMKKKFGCAGKLNYVGIWLQGDQTANVLRFLATDFELASRRGRVRFNSL